MKKYASPFVLLLVGLFWFFTRHNHLEASFYGLPSALAVVLFFLIRRGAKLNWVTYLASAYLLVELIPSGIFFSTRRGSFWLFENTAPLVFDPVQGYRIPKEGGRTARIVNGQLEFLGKLKGNQEGFSDSQDFTRNKPRQFPKRFLVFGDSFTAAHQYVKVAWPERAQEISGDQFINLALAGGGIANWWEVYDKYILKNGVEFDGVIFAALEDDLYRPFTFRHDVDRLWHSGGKVCSTDSSAIPSNASEVENVVESLEGFLLPTETFERALANQLSVFDRNPYIAPHLFKYVQREARFKWRHSRFSATVACDQMHGRLTREQIEVYVERFASAMKQKKIPLLVAHIPVLLNYDGSFSGRRETLVPYFAEKMGAKLISREEILSSLTPEGKRALYFPHDGHMNQTGQDHLASVILKSGLGFSGKLRETKGQDRVHRDDHQG